MSLVNFTNLDFDQIKTSIKDYLRSNQNFTDYDFEGSNLSTIIDVLAYNTYINAYNASMVTNEVFIDSATLRENVVSLARNIGYVPRSKKCATAVVSFTVDTSEFSIKPLSLTLKKGLFSTSGTSLQSITFSIPEDITVPVIDNSAKFEDIAIYEGTYVENYFTVDSYNKNQRFILDNPSIDTSTIRVNVNDSQNSTVSKNFKLSDSIFEIDSYKKVFFIQEIEDERYEIFFGDNVLGKKLSPGNLVIVQYLSSQGSLCNVSENINQYFSLGASIGGVELDVPILATMNSSGGDEPDSIEEIKFKAPRYRASKNRAVTAEDYKSIILANYPLVESVSVWGGEVNDPPKYGKIIISLKPYSGYNLSDKLKNRITNEILSSKKMLSIIPEFIDPNYLHLTLETTVKYNSKNSKFNSQDIELLSKEAIQRYFKTELQKFDRDFIYSKLSRYVDEIDNSVIGNTTIIRLQKRIMPIVNAKNFYTDSNTIKFANKLISGSIYSTVFNYNLNGEIISVYMKDSITDKNVSSLSLYNSLSERLIVSEIGTVDYLTGVLDIPVLNISGFLDNTTDVRIYARTDNLDIAATKDLILVIDDTVMDTTVKKSSGLVVKVIEE